MWLSDFMWLSGFMWLNGESWLKTDNQVMGVQGDFITNYKSQYYTR